MGNCQSRSGDGGKLVAVLTGDIVGSSQLPPDGRAALVDRLKGIAAEIRHCWPEAMAADIDVFSGDSWQILLSAPPLALRLAVFIRAALIGFDDGMDTRLAIGIGTMSDAPFDRVSQADGEAFHLSGRALEAMGQAKVKEAPWMRVRTSLASREGGWDAAAQLLDAVMRSVWTAPRAMAVAGAVRGWSQETISAKWPSGITQAGVSKHLRAAAWGAVEGAITLFESDWAD